MRDRDETRHIVAIKEYYETMAKKDKAPQLCAVIPGYKTIKERLIFGTRDSELLKRINPDADELKAYEIEMDEENDPRIHKRTEHQGLI